MDTDDPRQPLLGGPRRRWRQKAVKFCNIESWRRRVPITIWLPKYNLDYLLSDAIAAWRCVPTACIATPTIRFTRAYRCFTSTKCITVGLTAIPQGIAYAMLAGLPPQVGLYSSAFPGIMYAIFGSCKDVTVGPTAILAALIAKYVAQSPDFAYLATFLSGCLILLLGVLQLGFLLDFISKPVISGFTTAAALQISASQLKSLFRITGSSGGTFINAVINFFKNIKTVQPWDPVLGVSTIIALLLLKRATIPTSPTDSRTRIVAAKVWVYFVRARNALVVFVGLLLAYVLSLYAITPFALTGKIEGGLPHFGPPPFSTTVNNKTLNFQEMLQVFGAEGLAMPLVAILESIAIAKAFAGSRAVDATQEMLAIGASNIFASLAQSMPATGSFTRTALNHASGVVTPAGALFKAVLVLLSVTLLADAFFFIPRATLAGIIMVAMLALIDFTIVKHLWISSKAELAVWALTLCVGAGAGLEYGIAAGAGADALRALAAAARPRLRAQLFKVGHRDCAALVLPGALSYAAAEHVPRALRRAAACRLLVLDARALHSADLGVLENLITVILDLEQAKHRVLLWNFDMKYQKLLDHLHPGMASRFVCGPSIDQFILDINHEGHV